MNTRASFSQFPLVEGVGVGGGVGWVEGGKLRFVCILEAVKLAKMYTGEVGNWAHSNK